MRIKEIIEASGHIPDNEKEAHDPRWSNALTVDIGPGEDKKQAAKFGFKISKDGKVPKLNPSGKVMRVKDVTEAVMSVGVQSKHPISAGARGLMGARFRYDKAVETNSHDSDKNAVDQLEFNLRHVPETTYDYINMLMQHICEKFRVEPKKLHNMFVQKFSCTPDSYAIKYKKSREGQPREI
jgi:hypothetical protein